MQVCVIKLLLSLQSVKKNHCKFTTHFTYGRKKITIWVFTPHIDFLYLRQIMCPSIEEITRAALLGEKYTFYNLIPLEGYRNLLF